MHAELTHKEQFHFSTKIRNHVFSMDTSEASGGTNKGPTPKEMLIASIIGCTAMDVIAILKKYKTIPTSFQIFGDAEPRSHHPRVFTEVKIKFDVQGPDIAADVLIKAVSDSLTKFCGVSAMVAAVVPIHYEIILNQITISTGHAHFEI